MQKPPHDAVRLFSRFAGGVLNNPENGLFFR
jgi:hypothetical protein